MEKKKRDYILLLVFMILSYLSITVVGKISPQGKELFNAVGFLTMVTIVGWYVFLYRVTFNFLINKIFRRVLIVLMVSHLVITSIVTQRSGTPVSELLVLATISYCGSLVGFSLTFYVIVKDIFTRKHDLTYSLLGASNIYFMIPLVFTYIYGLVALHDPSYVNADPIDISTVLFHSWDYSWSVIAGIDYTAGKVGDAIQSIAVLEAIAGNLFIVFIIGRLMSRSEIPEHKV
jgi:hypothetical protein